MGTEPIDCPVLDDGRRWWFVGAELWPTTVPYAARSARSAIAAFRRDLIEAEVAGGRSQRETLLYVRAARLAVTEGPLSTPEAYELDLGWQLAVKVVGRWGSRSEPTAPLSLAEARSRLTEQEIAAVCASARRRFSAGA